MSTAPELRAIIPYWPTHADLVERAAAEIERLLAVIRAIDHTLSVHGHIDADTPLHERIRKASLDQPVAQG